MRGYLLKDSRFLSALLSFIGIGFLLAITLTNTTPELDRQDEYFIWAVTGLSVAALFTALFSNIKSKSTLLDGLVICFFIWLFVSYEFVSPVNASGKWMQTVYMFVLYGSLRMLLPAYKQMERFLLAAVIFCGLWESTLGLMQILGFSASHHHLYAATGTFFNSGPYGGFLAITISIALAFLVKHYQKFNRQCKLIKRFPRTVLKNPDFALYLLSGLSFCLSFLTFFAAMSRAAMLGLLISAVAIVLTQKSAKIFLSDFFKKNRKKAIAIFGTVFALIIIGTMAAYHFKKGSADSRLLIWEVSSNAIIKQPLLGFGFGAFFGIYSDESATYFINHPSSPAIDVAGVPEYSFNEYLQTGVETGLVGMLLLLSILFLAWYRLIKTKSLFAYGLMVVMVFALFSFPFSQLPFQIVLVVFVAAGVEKQKAEGRKATICFVLFLTAFGLSSIYQEKIHITKEWQSVRSLYHTQSYEQARKEYAVFFPLLRDNPRFLFEYGHALNKTGRFTQSNAILQEGARLNSDPMFYNVMGNNYKELGAVNRAEEAYQHAFDILPNRLYPLYLLMILYAETGQEEKATNMAQRVVSFTPKVDSPAIRDIKREAKDLLP